MNNKKLIRNIVIAVVVLALLVCGLIFAMKMPDSNTDIKEEENSFSDIAEDIKVLEFENKDVDKITVENENETFTIINKGEGNYELADNKGIPYASSLLSGEFNSFLSINAQKDLTGEDVGFKETARASIYLKDGSVKEVILGNEVIGQNQHFLQYEGRTYAVLTYIASYFTIHTDNFRQRNLASIAPDVKSVMIKKDGADYVGFKVAETDDEANILDVTTSFVLTYPKKMVASEDRLRPFYEMLGENGYSVEVAYFADNDISNRKKYGIGKKTAVIEDSAGKYTLEFGNKDKNGYVYTVFNNGNYIFATDSTLFDILDTYTPDLLMDKSAHLVLITKINQLVIEGKGEKFTFDISGKEDNYTYKINGGEIDEDKFKEAYREIIGITVDSMLPKAIDAKNGDYTITFRYTDGKTQKYEYVSYDDRNYLLAKDGKGEKLLLKKRLPEVIENIKRIIK